MARFADIFDDVTKQGRKIPTNEYLERGMHPIIDQGQKEIAGYSNEEAGLFCDVPAIIFGDHTRVIKYVDTPCFLGADGVKLLKAKKSDANYKYLFYALSSANIPNTGYNRHFKWLKEVEIPTHTENEQNDIVAVLDKVSGLIALRKQQLAKLDELVKARFVELFGDAEHNEKGLPTSPMTELCEIIDGDRGKNYPKQEEFSEEGFCLFLNAKNVTSNGFSFENCMYITEEKDKILRNGKLSRGDVVLTTRGTLGNLAFYDESVPYEHMRINSGMVILRMKRDRITERFFIEQFKMQLASIKERIASGSAQPQLPISTMNKIVMLVPDVELQNQFAAFVKQTDKSKLTVQQSLDKLELLKKALMQKYFG